MPDSLSDRVWRPIFLYISANIPVLSGNFYRRTVNCTCRGVFHQKKCHILRGRDKYHIWYLISKCERAVITCWRRYHCMNGHFEVFLQNENTFLEGNLLKQSNSNSRFFLERMHSCAYVWLDRKRKTKVGGKRYKARSRGCSSPDTLAFWACGTPRR